MTTTGAWKWIFVQILFFAYNLIEANPFLIDPVIPDGETITYLVKEEDEEYTLIQRTYSLQEGGRDYYNVHSESKAETSLVHMDRTGMFVFYSFLRKNRAGISAETEWTLLESAPLSREKELRLYDLTGINHLLRGFPFPEKKKIGIASVQSGELGMYVKLVGEKTLKTPAGEIDCYVLELGFEDLWGMFLPKIHFWYSQASPHYCVKFKGQQGPPGTPETTIILVSYSDGKF